MQSQSIAAEFVPVLDPNLWIAATNRWLKRQETRRVLSRLDDHLLDDIRPPADWMR